MHIVIGTVLTVKIILIHGGGGRHADKKVENPLV